MIRFKELPIDYTDTQAVISVMGAKSLGMGKTVAQLEEEFASYIGSKYAVAFNSCTNALFLALHQEEPTTVSIPSMMVALVANEIIHTGHNIHFTDDCDWVGHSYHLLGTNIIDSAHEVEPLPKSVFDTHQVCYSFYPTKPVCGADGGIICTNDKDKAEWYKKARFFGRDNGDSIAKNSWEYGFEFAGWKMNMSDIQAAIVLNRLRQYPGTMAKMIEIREKYNTILGKNNSSNYLYRIDVQQRDNFIDYMKTAGIECGVHFYPLHMVDMYKKYGQDSMVSVEERYSTTVSLPFHIFLSDREIEYICDKVEGWGK